MPIEKGFFKLYRSANFIPSRTPYNHFLMTEEQREIRLLKKAFKEKYHHDIELQMEISSWETIANFVKQGIGIGFVPEFAMQKYIHEGVQEYHLGLPPFPYTVYAIYPKGEKLSRNAEYFLSLFNSVIDH